jgi:hypothetical protein
VSRVLRRLRERGLLDVRGRRVAITQPARLAALGANALRR